MKIANKKNRKKLFFKNKDESLLIYNEDFLKTDNIPKNSIDLIITSPPYNVDIHYNAHPDNLTYDDYLEFTQKWIRKGTRRYKKLWRPYGISSSISIFRIYLTRRCFSKSRIL